MRSFAKLAVAVTVAAVVITGCRCGGNVSRRSVGEVRIVYDENGVRVSTGAGDPAIATYDFGQVPMGKAVSQKVTIQNTGTGVLTVDKFEKVDGAPVQLGLSGDPAPVFVLAYESIDIPSGESKEFGLTFQPPVDPVEKTVDHLATLVLRAVNTDPGKESAQIIIKGRAVSGECELPKTIDFGAVARGDTFTTAMLTPPLVTLKNTRPIDSLAFVGDIQSAQGDNVFAYTPESPRGEVLIGSNREKTITIGFTPTEARDYFATVIMRAADGCPDVHIRLVGTGVDQVLSWSPATVDFGYVTPGLMVPGEVTFSNQGFKPVELTAMGTFEGTASSGVFKVTATDNADLTKLSVPAASRYNNPSDPADPMNGKIVPATAKTTMSFKPTVLGPKTGTLKAATDVKNQANIAVPLRGFGGGPDIDVRPAPVLNVGRIAFFTGQSTYATRKLTISNVGTRPTPPDPRANLKLGVAGAGAPYWTVTPKNAISTEDEICVGVFDTGTNTCTRALPAPGQPGGYDPGSGLEASGTRATIDVPVRITPTGLGQKEWEIVIASNDPDEAEVKITVQANVVNLPPCQYQVTPLNLNFGVVTPPNTRDLGFQIRNLSSNAGDICLISNLDLKAGSDPTFTLPAGPIAEQELQPGDTMTVLVRAWPQGQLPPSPTSIQGWILFNASSPTQPEKTVNLQATLAPSCLTISPSDLDFGTVQKDCNSPDRTFQIYNTCSQPVTVQQFSMIAAAGEPAGGPNCPGTSPCPEFHTVSTAGINPGTVINPGGAMPLTFSLKYRPINYGPDTGAFLLKVTQNGQTVDYVVTLRGKGDQMGLNTDTFRQDSKPKADILLVIDDSCSMSDKQTALGTNFASFMRYAISSQVDFQIAITNTELSDSYWTHGVFKSSPGGHKILRPTTPNLSSEFASVVMVGVNGGSESCMDPAVLALTAPFITDPAKNAGFLRQDAVLAVVCVTDAVDQAVQPASYYLNQLINIKGAQRPSAFTYNVVGPFLQNEPPGCMYDSVMDDGKHMYMVTQTNGVKEEICTPDWATALENIGKNAFGFRTNFYLTARPDLSGSNVISVQIDGVALPPTDPRGARVWEYDSTSNSINFEPLYVPEPGKTLTVTYQVACIP